MNYSNYRYLLALFSMAALLALTVISSWSPAINSIMGIFFSHVCHREPARCLSLNGVPMVVCARCFGIYAGAYIGIAAAPLAFRWNAGRRIFIMFAPMLLDAALNAAFTTPPVSRFLTGLLAGFAAAVIALPAFIEPAPWRKLARQVK